MYQKWLQCRQLLTASATAISASVTVSIGEDTNGALSVISLVSGDDNSTSSAVKSINPGSMIKSLLKFKEKREKIRIHVSQVVVVYICFVFLTTGTLNSLTQNMRFCFYDDTTALTCMLDHRHLQIIPDRIVHRINFHQYLPCYNYLIAFLKQ